MSYRVQFVVSDEEHSQLLEMMSKEGFNSLSELCKEKIFGKTTYRQLYDLMVENIKALQEGETFHLSDVVDAPAPAILGKRLFEKVTDGTIANVKHLGKDTATNTEIYLKI